MYLELSVGRILPARTRSRIKTEISRYFYSWTNFSSLFLDSLVPHPGSDSTRPARKWKINMKPLHLRHENRVKSHIFFTSKLRFLLHYFSVLTADPMGTDRPHGFENGNSAEFFDLLWLWILVLRIRDVLEEYPVLWPGYFQFAHGSTIAKLFDLT